MQIIVFKLMIPSVLQSNENSSYSKSVSHSKGTSVIREKIQVPHQNLK